MIKWREGKNVNFSSINILNSMNSFFFMKSRRIDWDVNKKKELKRSQRILNATSAAKHGSVCIEDWHYVCTSSHNRTGWDRIQKLKDKNKENRSDTYDQNTGGHIHLNKFCLFYFVVDKKEDMKSVSIGLTFFRFCFFPFFSLWLFLLLTWLFSSLHSLSRSKNFPVCVTRHGANTFVIY